MKAIPIVLLLLFCSSGLVGAPPSGTILVDKEELSYQVKWTSFSAGQIELSTTKMEGGAAAPYEIRLTAKTNSFVSMFYRVENLVLSHVAADSFKSLYYYKNIRQGRRNIEEKSTFDYAGNVIHFSRQNLGVKNESAGLQEFPMGSANLLLQDPLSLIYCLRTLEFRKPGDEQQMQVFADKGIYELRFKFLGEESISTASFGTKNVLHVKPTAIYRGAFVDDGELELWLDQSTRIPLRMKFSIPVGWATLELTTSSHPELQPVPARSWRHSGGRFK